MYVIQANLVQFALNATKARVPKLTAQSKDEYTNPEADAPPYLSTVIGVLKIEL